MGIRSMWTAMMDLLRNVPFLDEALWDWGRAWFKGKETPAVATATATDTSNTRNDSMPKARRAVALLYTSKVNPVARKNWQDVVWGNPDFRPYQERVEVALEDLLERLEERAGAFPIQHGRKVVRESVEDKKKTTVTETPSGSEPREGFGGHELFVEAINEAGRDPNSLKHFIHGITHERIFERVGDRLGGVAGAVKPALFGIVLFFALYALALWVAGRSAFINLTALINEPSLGSAIKGFTALGVFAFLASPINRILPKG